MRDYHQEMVDGIIAALEKGTAPWQRPWDANAVPPIPLNPTTGKEYRGGNALWLMCKEMDKGYEDNRWMTFKQAQEHGWQVKKGEHGSCIAYWKRAETVKEHDPETGELTRREVPLKRPVPFYAVVFNAQQVDGIPPMQRREVNWDPAERAESILSGSGARIIHDGGNRAFYRPISDDIHLPARADFPDAGAYYDTALHELGHWTGHETRLNRPFGNMFGSPEYAKEELRAEISSFFTGAEISLPHNVENHAAYVGSWVKVLQNDKYEIFRAARDAEQITDYLLGKELNREQQADQVAELQGVYGERIEIRTQTGVGEYEWRPGIIVEEKQVSGGGKCYEVLPDSNDRGQVTRVSVSNVRPATPSREELIKAAPFAGTVNAGHIEQPKESFVVAVLRAPSYNAIYKPEHWEVWRVQAETPDGAMKVARYHFYENRAIEFLGPEAQQDAGQTWINTLSGSSIAVAKVPVKSQPVYWEDVRGREAAVASWDRGDDR